MRSIPWMALAAFALAAGCAAATDPTEDGEGGGADTATSTDGTASDAANPAAADAANPDDPRCAVHAGEECNPYCGTGCAEGQVCRFRGNIDGWQCSVPGAGAPGATCTAPTDCAAGACGRIGGAAETTCLWPCITDADCGGDRCNLELPNAAPYASFCNPSAGAGNALCKPLFDPCPDTTKSCYVTSDQTYRIQCLPPGTGAPGSACSSGADCDPLSACTYWQIDGTELSVCTQMCSTDPAHTEHAFGCTSICGSMTNAHELDPVTHTGVCTSDIPR